MSARGVSRRARPLRVVLTGSESTGKTTLARQLAEAYGIEWVPEFVRVYTEDKGAAPEFADHGPIARGQMALEDAHQARAVELGLELIVQDTDLLSTAVYSAHYFGRCPEWIEAAARERRPDLYLLLDIDLPWVPDPQRDRGHMRPEMHALFRGAVERSGAPYVIITGHGPDRLRAARQAIDALLAMPDEPG